MKKLIAVLLVMLLVVAGAAYASEADKVYGLLGEEAKLGDISMLMTNVVEYGKNEYYIPAEGNEYVVIEFYAVNNGVEDVEIASLLNFNAWCDGEACVFSTAAVITSEYFGHQLMDCVVKAGESFTGVVGYEVPENWQEITVEFKLDVVDEEAVVFAAQNAA